MSATAYSIYSQLLSILEAVPPSTSLGLSIRGDRNPHYHVWGRGAAYAGFWCGNLRERNHLEDPGVDGRRITLRRIFRMWDVGVHGLDRVGLGQGQVAGTCECGNEPSGYGRCGEFLD